MPATIDQAALNTALLKLARRAESVDPQKLVQTFVDIGPLMALLSSADHQIVYGRRGTGKTHALLYSAEEAKKRGDLPIYVDLRYIGSSGGIYGDPNISVAQRATTLLSDVLSSVHNALLTVSIDRNLDLSMIGPRLDRLAASITDVHVSGEVKREMSNRTSLAENHSATVSLEASLQPKLAASSSGGTAAGSEQETKVQESGLLVHRVHFGSVSSALRDIVGIVAPSRLLVILDEWSTLPLELQPFLADLLRRAVFPVAGVTVKIAAIEQRSVFKLGRAEDYRGIEIGADASADIDLDDFMVFDNNSERATQFFRELLYRHYSADEIGGPPFDSADAFVTSAFTQVNAFEDFVKAAEGVPRDSFNILMIAAQRDIRERISIPTIRVAARTWYQRDKESAIKADMQSQELLHWIIDQVIAHRRARAFLLLSNTRHQLIDALFDARLLHVIKKSISANDQPGVRYDAYKLDYGCYVDLLATTRSPDLLFAADDEDVAAKIVVPPDDYRAIRRAILDLKTFENARIAGGLDEEMASRLK
jgi:hypothetical protein